MTRASEINPDHLDELQRDAEKAPPNGCLVEVGVYRGGSAARLVAGAKGRVVWLFDTFSGIPEATAGVDFHRVGDFIDTSAALVMGMFPDARVVVGDARETVSETDTGPVAFAHIDCDQYETTRAVIAALLPRMVRGGVMALDDYVCLDGARRAVDELLPGRVVYSSLGQARVRF